MKLCGNCPFGPWEAANPVSEEAFLGKLEGVGIEPTNEGQKQVGIGSPFRFPTPLIIRICCLDAQACDAQGVNFSGLKTIQEASIEINQARAAVYEEAGLPPVESAS